MKVTFLLLTLAIISCARTYHVYNIVCENSTLNQTIEVKADVPKTTSVTTEAEVSAIP